MNLGDKLRNIAKIVKEDEKNLTDYEYNVLHDVIEDKMISTAGKGKNELYIFNGFGEDHLYRFIMNHKKHFKKDGVKVYHGASDCFVLKW